MNALKEQRATIGVLARESRADARLNIGDRLDVKGLCATLVCSSTDVYVAIATAGDKLWDVRRHLRQVLGREKDRATTIPHMKRLQPLWPTAA